MDPRTVRTTEFHQISTATAIALLADLTFSRLIWTLTQNGLISCNTAILHACASQPRGETSLSLSMSFFIRLKRPCDIHSTSLEPCYLAADECRTHALMPPRRSSVASAMLATPIHSYCPGSSEYSLDLFPRTSRPPVRTFHFFATIVSRADANDECLASRLSRYPRRCASALPVVLQDVVPPTLAEPDKRRLLGYVLSLASPEKARSDFLRLSRCMRHADGIFPFHEQRFPTIHWCCGRWN
ncbi:hypothetical protein C8Q70DRAFT_1019496, partial [Cubamyces menziesii]